MVDSSFSAVSLYTTVQKADFRRILNGGNYAEIRGQIIFEKEGEIVVTQIDNRRHKYTVEDYMQLPEGAPFQLINGKLISMPSPIDSHQLAVINLLFLLETHVRKIKSGKVRIAPLDVHFNKDNIYQPDLLFISNERKHILKDYVYGAPDLVVEIASPGTKDIDEGDKMEVYGQYGLLEYWIIDPWKKTLSKYVNQGGKMALVETFSGNEKVKSSVLKRFSFGLEEVFEE